MKSASLGACAIAAVLASCSTNVGVTAKPGAENLSGSYRFAGIDKARPENFPNPLINWGGCRATFGCSDRTNERSTNRRAVYGHTRELGGKRGSAQS